MSTGLLGKEEKVAIFYILFFMLFGSDGLCLKRSILPVAMTLSLFTKNIYLASLPIFSVILLLVETSIFFKQAVIEVVCLKNMCLLFSFNFTM